MTVADARQDRADFVAPTFTDVKQIVVTGPGAPAIVNLDDLSGQTVHVRQISAYYESLKALSSTLTQRNRAPIVVKFVPDALEDEDILEMVNTGLVKITVVDASRQGLDPNVWFNNAERIASARIGRETVQYVSNIIYKCYVAYQLAWAERESSEAR